MMLRVTRHAIMRYCERVRQCSKRHAIQQIEAAYALGKNTHTLPGGHRFIQSGSLRLVVDPSNRVTTVYLTQQQKRIQ